MSVVKPTPIKVFPKQLLTTSMVKDSLQNVKNHLHKFNEYIKQRIVLNAVNWGNWGMDHIKGAYEEEVIPFVKNLRESFKLFEMGLYKTIEKKQLLINNDRLLEENILCDVMCIFFLSLHRVDNCESCKSLEIEILNQQESNKSFNELSKRLQKVEEYFISLELSLQHTKEKIICDESWKIHDVSLITEINKKYFEINDLKAKLQDKSIVVNELKQLLAKLKEKSQVTPYETTNLDSWFQKLDDEIVSLAFKVSSLVKEREHLKVVYKNIYDSIKQTRAQNKLKTDPLQQKLNNQISENAKLRVQLQAKFSEPQENQNGTNINTKFAKPPTSRNKLYFVTPFPKTQFIPKVVEKNNLSKSVTSHLHTNKVFENCTKVLALGLFRIKSEPINAYFKNKLEL
ncbi:hypothetical protein Tco_1274571 [Tanacetum coccineum]